MGGGTRLKDPGGHRGVKEKIWGCEERGSGGITGDCETIK